MSQPVLSDPFVLYQSERLGAYPERLIHGFTGKPVTFGGPGCDAATVADNRRLLCRRMGLNAERLALPRQTHSDQFRLNDAVGEDSPCDAVIVTEPDVPAMVQVADCVPVLLYAPDRHAAAAVHAGWRGTAQGITARVAAALIDTHGADPAQLLAVIGPAIGGCCYEVSEAVCEAVAATVAANPADWSVRNANGRPVIDLKAVNRLQLAALGVSQVEVLTPCTRCETETLWSYRRGEAGRQVGFIQLKSL